MNEIKCIVFDFGKVIADFDHMKTCKGLSKFCKLTPKEIYEKIFKSGLEKRYDEGLDSQLFYAEVKKMLDSEDLDFDNFSRIWGDIFIRNPDIEDVLEKINTDIRKMLLSNTNEIHYRYFIKLGPVAKYFNKNDDLILSFKLGFKKPDKRIFLEAIKRSGFNPNEMVYVDDILEYVDEAKSMGMKGINYDCSRDPIEKLRDNLVKMKAMRS